MENQTKTRINVLPWKGKAISNSDYIRLTNQINEDIEKSHVPPGRLHSLYLLLTKSKRFDSQNFPENVVRINSKIIVSTENKHRHIIRIVLPEDIYSKNDISIYNPIAMACLGAKEKDYVNIKNTNQKILIEKIILQPDK